MSLLPLITFFFFFNDTATTEIYTLSLHDALPICFGARILPPPMKLVSFLLAGLVAAPSSVTLAQRPERGREDRKSTRLNSSHSQISYAVFCLKKKKINQRV